jgi:hypothetical protein
MAGAEPALAGLRIPRDNYSHMDGINDTQVDVAYYFQGKWAGNTFAGKLEGAPFSDDVRRDLLKLSVISCQFQLSSFGGGFQSRVHRDS